MTHITGAPTDVAVQMIGVNKWYGDFHVLRDIDLVVRRGEKVVVCGPSGSGKSTAIRCINRLEEHREGRIIVDGIELNSDMRRIQSVRSKVGMVFQNFNLFPHLSVLDNLTLGPTLTQGVDRFEAEDRALELLRRVRIPEQAQQVPRAALGRAAAARGDRPCPDAAAQGDALRRTDLRARSRDDP